MFVVDEVMCVCLKNSSSGSIILNAKNVCFILNKLYVKLKVFSSNVAFISNSIVTATGSMASTSTLTERILGERMCA